MKSHCESARAVLPGTDLDEGLRLVRVDKIGSAAINLGLDHDMVITPRYRVGALPRPGDAVVARAVTDNATYNHLELATGRSARINPGDVIAGILGYRRALKGFVGDVPSSLKAGDRLHLLNMGGLIGTCSGRHHSLSNPIELEVMGLAVREGRILNIGEQAITPRPLMSCTAPLIVVAGTCMNSGKTYAATEIIKHLTRAGMRIAAAKLSGVACLRDTLNMQDHGAIKTLSFLDCGLPSTVGVGSLAPYAKGIIDSLFETEPDAIVLELGDGILGGYGVDSVFEDPEIMGLAAAVVFCANDFVGAWGGRQLLAQYGANIDVVSGPVTDSQMGCDYLRAELGLESANGVNEGERLAGLVKERLEQWSK